MKIETVCVCCFLALAIIPAAFAGKTELTTYYPSPYGEYENLYVSNKVGIGTTSPAVALDVNGAMRSIAATTPSSGVGLELLYNTGSSFGRILAYDRTTPGYKDLYLGSANQLYLKAAGNVGIGTTAPAEKLEVNGKAKANSVVLTPYASKAVIDGLPSPTPGEMAYATSEDKTYQYNGTSWNALGSGGGCYTKACTGLGAACAPAACGAGEIDKGVIYASRDGSGGLTFYERWCCM